MKETGGRWVGKEETVWGKETLEDPHKKGPWGSRGAAGVREAGQYVGKGGELWGDEALEDLHRELGARRGGGRGYDGDGVGVGRGDGEGGGGVGGPTHEGGRRETGARRVGELPWLVELVAACTSYLTCSFLPVHPVALPFPTVALSPTDLPCPMP